jgi:hypothetical protein
MPIATQQDDAALLDPPRLSEASRFIPSTRQVSERNAVTP